MIGRRLTPWLLVLSLVSCGPDGGTSGTGITGGTSGTGVASDTVDPNTARTTIEGFVSAIREARVAPSDRNLLLAEARRFLQVIPAAVAAGGVEGIRARVDGASGEAWTDENGYFSLTGRFGETPTLLFDRGSGSEATLPAIAPEGSRLTLQSVEVDFSSGSANASREAVRFEAIVVDTDCRGGTVSVTSQAAPEGSTFVVQTDGATISSPEGRPLTCREIEQGDPVGIAGAIQPDGTIGESDTRDPSETMPSFGL